MVVMWLIGGLLIWLAIKKDYEPALLLPMGFGAILVNLPDTGVLGDNGIIQWLYNVGIGASEAVSYTHLLRPCALIFREHWESAWG